MVAGTTGAHARRISGLNGLRNISEPRDAMPTAQISRCPRAPRISQRTWHVSDMVHCTGLARLRGVRYRAETSEISAEPVAAMPRILDSRWKSVASSASAPFSPSFVGDTCGISKVCLPIPVGRHTPRVSSCVGSFGFWCRARVPSEQRRGVGWTLRPRVVT